MYRFVAEERECARLNHKTEEYIYINESLFLLLILNRAESEWESTGVVLTDSG